MALELTTEKLAKTATNTVSGFDMVYSFEHFADQHPESIKARGTIEGSKTVLDATYYPSNGNFTSIFHYLSEDIEVGVISSVLADMKSLALVV